MFPLALAFIVGTMCGAYLYFQNEAMNNGARAASRWATIEGSLNVGATHCESGSPDSIVGQVQKNAKTFLPINPGQLCAKVVSAGPPVVYSTTELVQLPYVANQANIVVDASPSLTSPECITVNLTYTSPAFGPFPAIVMQAHSSAPTLSATTASNCPAPTKAG